MNLTHVRFAEVVSECGLKRYEEDIEYIIECDNDFCGLTYGISCAYNREEIEKAWNNVTALPMLTNPPVEPTKRTGRWIVERYCSECEWDKKDAELVCNIPTNYCPNCGAKMEG